MGKKYRNLFGLITDEQNMRLAYYKTAKGRRYTPGALAFKEYIECNLQSLREDIVGGSYQMGEVSQFYVYDPKQRLISALPFRDRVAQHALCNIIGPIFEKTFLPRSLACRPDKGAHGGVISLQSDLRRMSKGETLYVLKTDFSKFFPSVRLDVLHRAIRAKISCRATLGLIEAMVPPEGVGLPVGSLTSQLFANVYGNILDRYLQQELRESNWYRYMDDLVVLGHDLQHLRVLKERIEEFALQEMGLRYSKWSISPATRGVNFLGYRIWPTHKLLRKQSVTRAKRKIKYFKKHGRDEDLKLFVASWFGHAQWADSQNLLRSLELDIQQCTTQSTPGRTWRSYAAPHSLPTSSETFTGL